MGLSQAHSSPLPLPEAHPLACRVGGFSFQACLSFLKLARDLASPFCDPAPAQRQGFCVASPGQ